MDSIVTFSGYPHCRMPDSKTGAGTLGVHSPESILSAITFGGQSGARPRALPSSRPAAATKAMLAIPWASLDSWHCLAGRHFAGSKRRFSAMLGLILDSLIG
jgi:hypothetical protein